LVWDTPDEQGLKVNKLPRPAAFIQDPEHPHGRQCLQNLAAVVASSVVPGFDYIASREIPQIAHGGSHWFFRHDPPAFAQAEPTHESRVGAADCARVSDG
jgi:hypothetical protein